MAERDAERIEIAEQIRRELAIENEISSIQARSFVRCLQTTWDVDTIAWGDRDSNSQLSDARRLLHAAHIFQEIQGPESVGAMDCYRRAGELLEWMTRSDDSVRTLVPIEILASAAYQLGKLPAMASGLLSQVSIENQGVALYAAFLRADFDGVLSATNNFWAANPDLTTRDAGQLLSHEDVSDRVGADIDPVAWLFTVELVRSLGLIADTLRTGNVSRFEQARKKLEALAQMALRTLSEDAALIVSLLQQVTESYARASVYEPIKTLAAMNPEREPRLLEFARDQFGRGRGMLWSSQILGLKRLTEGSSFALCTPTGSGKTLVANLALVKELLLRPAAPLLAPLALYIVPSRALAGEVETKLRSELGRDMIVTALYGGADWGITDFWLTGDEPAVVVVTVEKAEALLRYLGPQLIARLSVLIIDEAHQVVPDAKEQSIQRFAEHGSRALRLESLVSRVLTRKPEVARIALTAVAGGAAGPVARWMEGNADAQAVGLRYRSTRQVVGVLETNPNAANRVLLEIMNGSLLTIRGRDDPVYLPLRIPNMPELPARMRNSLNRFNSTSVLWTAMHLAQEDQRILISVAQSPERLMEWFTEALALDSWAGVPRFERPDGFNGERFDEARATCLDYCGEESFELALLDQGIATSHGQMPQRLRRLMTEMIDRRICPVTVATATLTEGVNLPFDLIFLTSLKRAIWDSANEERDEQPMSTAEFRNLSGRAGRPGASRGVEGMTLIAIPTRPSATAAGTIPLQRRQQQALSNDYEELRTRLLVEEGEQDSADSPLTALLRAIWDRAFKLGVGPDQFLQWLEITPTESISSTAGQDANDEFSQLADALDELDAVVLAAIAELEEIDDEALSPAQAEEHLSSLWQKTFSAVAAAQEEWMQQAFIKRGLGVAETFYPTSEERKRLYHYGFTPLIGRRFEALFEPILAILAASVGYGSLDAEARINIFEDIGHLLAADRGYGFRVRASVGDQAILESWPDVLGWWMNEPEVPGPGPKELRSWQRFTSDNLEFRMGVAIGAVTARIWQEGADNALAAPSLDTWKDTTGLPWFAFWARELLRWGTHEPFVAFALSQGVAKTRDEATERSDEYKTWLLAETGKQEPEDLIDPQLFLRWRASLPHTDAAAQASRTFSASLSGTDGRHDRYSVTPIVRDGSIRWLDPAGFELAFSTDRVEAIPAKAASDDYVLEASASNTRVIRTFGKK